MTMNLNNFCSISTEIIELICRIISSAEISAVLSLIPSNGLSQFGTLAFLLI